MHDDASADSLTEAEALFQLAWETLEGLVGAAATATVVRRGAAGASSKRPALTALVVERQDFDHHFQLPPSWAQNPTDAQRDFRALLDEIQHVLSQLTGQVAIRRLRSIPELRVFLEPAEEDTT